MGRKEGPLSKINTGVKDTNIVMEQKINKVYKSIVYINTYVHLMIRRTSSRLFRDGRGS